MDGSWFWWLGTCDSTCLCVDGKVFIAESTASTEADLLQARWWFNHWYEPGGDIEIDIEPYDPNKVTLKPSSSSRTAAAAAIACLATMSCLVMAL